MAKLESKVGKDSCSGVLPFLPFVLGRQASEVTYDRNVCWRHLLEKLSKPGWLWGKMTSTQAVIFQRKKWLRMPSQLRAGRGGGAGTGGEQGTRGCCPSLITNSPT